MDKSRMPVLGVAQLTLWSPAAKTAEEIGALEGSNWMVVYPYTKWMCSNMNVNQAAAVLMTRR